MLVLSSGVITAVNNRWAYNATMAMATTYLIFLIATNVIGTMRQLNLLLWLLLSVHMLFAVKGIFTGGLVGGSLMGDENDFALALNTFLPLAFFYFLDERRPILKTAALVALTVSVLGVISSMSRGGWVGLIAVLIFCYVKSRRIALSSLVAIILGVTVFLFAPSKYWDEIQTISDTSESTADARLQYWKAAVRMFVDHPVNGVGALNGGIRMPEYVTGTGSVPTEWGRTFHGTLPQVLAETGALGFILYFLMVFMAIGYLCRIASHSSSNQNRIYRTISNGLIGGYVGYLATATFLSTLIYPQVWTLHTLTLTLVFIWRRNENGGEEIPAISTDMPQDPEAPARNRSDNTPSPDD
jgi:O-antigen ligase